MKTSFIDDYLPVAPPTTEVEEKMMEKVEILKQSLLEKGKRFKGTIKEDIDKFLWKEGGKDWTGFSMTLDVSAEVVFARVFVIDTYKNSSSHQISNGDLPRVIRTNVENTRSQFYRLAMHFPSPLANRIFDVWLSWKQFKPKNGGKGFIVGYVPISEHPSKGFTDQKLDGVFEIANSTGLHIITEIAPNISRWTRIQNADVKMNLPKAALNKIASMELLYANEVQEEYRRNRNKVDTEVRKVLAARMREGPHVLTQDQEEAFKKLRAFFGGEEDGGWKPLKSSFEGVKTEIKHQQHEKGEKSVGFARAIGVADCSAEEAAAWFFEFCSRERVAADRAEGNPARLEIRREEERWDEKHFACVKKFSIFVSNRELVFKHILKSNPAEGSYTVAVVPIEESIDYGTQLSPVRMLVTGIFKATNIARGGVEQCKIEYTQHIDAGGFIPIKVIEKQSPYAVSIVPFLMEIMNKNEEIDEAER